MFHLFLFFFIDNNNETKQHDSNCKANFDQNKNVKRILNKIVDNNIIC